MDAVPYLAAASAIAALGARVYFYKLVEAASPGNERMVYLMTEIQNGAQGVPEEGVPLGRRSSSSR